MSTRLVTFLGLGNADHEPKTLYGRATLLTPSGNSYGPTHMGDVATICEVQGPLHMVVLGTSDVHQVWFEDGRFASDLRADLPSNTPMPTIEFVQIPHGETDDERWRFFDVLLHVLEPDARADEASAPETVVVDFTRGFRSAPVFAASALAYSQAVRMRSDGAQPKLKLIYGSYYFDKATKTATTTFQDYSLLLQALAWNNALTGLMRYGRADELEALLRTRQAKIMSGSDRPKHPPPFARFASAAKAFADTLATSRVPHMITRTAAHLRTAVEDARPRLTADVPPLGRALDNLVAHLDGLSADRVISHEGIEANLRLVRQTIKFERFTEAIGLLREVVIDIFICDQLPPSAITQPATLQQQFKTERARLTERLGFAAFKTPKPAAIPRIFSAIGQLRNDVQHCGYNPDPNSAHDIRKNLHGHLNSLEAVLNDRVFINLSNHPSVGDIPWSPAQIAAAEALGCGPVQDFEFPPVDPATTPEGIEALAGRTVSLLLSTHQVSAAFVAGELTLAFALVERLEAAGVACYAATTERTVVETKLDDGSVAKRSVFRFVGWRRYPRRLPIPAQ